MGEKEIFRTAPALTEQKYWIKTTLYIVGSELFCWYIGYLKHQNQFRNNRDILLTKIVSVAALDLYKYLTIQIIQIPMTLICYISIKQVEFNFKSITNEFH